MPVGIVWYRAEDYDRLKAMFTDGRKLPDTFESWLESAHNVYDMLTRRGFVIVKAYLDPDTFPGWCRARGMKMNAKARSHFGSDYAAKHHPAKGH